MPSLIRRTRFIADYPGFASRLSARDLRCRLSRRASFALRRRCLGDLAKCLRSDGATPPGENRVDKTLKGQRGAAAAARPPPLAPTISAAASCRVKVFD